MTKHDGDDTAAREPVYVSPVESARRNLGLPVYCPLCDYERHVCPGCGHSTYHGQASCGRCKSEPIEVPG